MAYRRRRFIRMKPHDLRGQYSANDVPRNARALPVVCPDPYGSGELTRQSARHRDGTRPAPGGAREWVATRPEILVLQAARGDQVGKMHARGQLSQARFLAARAYQQAHEQSNVESDRLILQRRLSTVADSVSRSTIARAALRRQFVDSTARSSSHMGRADWCSCAPCWFSVFPLVRSQRRWATGARSAAESGDIFFRTRLRCSRSRRDSRLGHDRGRRSPIRTALPRRR